MHAPASSDPFVSHEIDILQEALLQSRRETAERDLKIAALMAQIETLQQQLLNLRRMHFGATSEKLAGQADLFTETATLPIPPEDPKVTVPVHQRRKGRAALPDHLPRERREYDLSEAEKAEFDRVKRIGEEISNSLEYTPARLVVVEHVRAKYACFREGFSTIRTAFAEPSPLPKSNAGASLLAHILTATFIDHMPLHRQEMAWKRQGVGLPRSTLGEYKLGSGELLGHLRPALIKHLLAAPRVHSDDTKIPMQQKGMGTTKTARLWGYLGAGARQGPDKKWVEHPPAVVFEFTESREAIHPVTFLGNYKGYLQADAYGGYDALFKTGQIAEVGCMAHCRRKFFEITKTQKTPGLAAEAIRWIARLYEIESRIKGEPPDKKLKVRQAESVPILADFKVWLDGHYGSLLPQGPLALAFGYAIRQWQALTRYTGNGILLIDNNLMESQMRPIALGRKNFLFVGSERGGEVAATVYALIATCKLNGVEPYAYLKDVLGRIRSHRVDRLAELLPFNWKPLGA